MDRGPSVRFNNASLMCGGVVDPALSAHLFSEIPPSSAEKCPFVDASQTLHHGNPPFQRQ